MILDSQIVLFVCTESGLKRLGDSDASFANAKRETLLELTTLFQKSLLMSEGNSAMSCLMAIQYQQIGVANLSLAVLYLLSSCSGYLDNPAEGGS